MNLFGSNTNTHKNKVQTRPTLSVKELETKLVLVRPKESWNKILQSGPRSGPLIGTVLSEPTFGTVLSEPTFGTYIRNPQY